VTASTGSAAMGWPIRLFVCGDVMTGRGIDQILPHPSQPRLYEARVQSAVTYVELAEAASGPIGRALDPSYPWGGALEILQERQPAARIVNLETAITTSGHAQPAKGIHYRMHPANVACLVQAGVDWCVLANNHVLDWGRSGLAETIETLRSAEIHWLGAGEDSGTAAQPAQLALSGGARLLVFAFAAMSSGVPASWAATATRAGVNFIESVDARTADRVARTIVAQRRPGDLVVVSLHWGGNWGFSIPREHRQFAHALAQSGAADLVHGHSSHHVQAIEVVHGKLVLYGCGDFINDYEGIGGHEAYGPGLALMYFPVFDANRDLVELDLVPMRRHRLRLQRANTDDCAWLARTLRRECAPFGTGIRVHDDGGFSLTWGSAPTARDSD
jgi:poly-gamma-glutamate capsule biosynthesis protein CapA/YwtB (metallophosphatase superfamily)